MDMTGFWKHIAKVAFSVLCAGVLYFLWMGAFIVLSDRAGSIGKGVLWILAPVVTATGFALGLAVSERRLNSMKASFVRISVWPLAGCAVGAAAMYWFGPMLIVFGMFLAGTASVMLREAKGKRK